MFRKLDDRTFASPQITPDQVAEAAALGVALIVNNRPDGEDATQAEGAAIERAAAQAGLDYVAIPVDHSGFSIQQVDAMAGALERASGPVLAYCRSGTRSTFLWALARAKGGAEPHELSGQAAMAGYDLAPIRPLLEALARR